MRKYSQVFLKSENIADRIASAAARHAECDFVVEIGPGKGFLTAHLLKRFAHVTAMEIDPDMVKILRPQFPEDKLTIHNIDFLEAGLEGIIPAGKKVLFVGNLPYAVGSAILQRILEYPDFRAAILMFQKEVCQRIVAQPDTKHYGLLALSAQSRSHAEFIIDVGKGLFSPVPAVDSGVVEFVRREEKLFESAEHEAAFFKFIRAAFAHRRKTILNSLSMGLCVSKEKAGQLLAAGGINPSARAETVDMATYLRAAKSLL